MPTHYELYSTELITSAKSTHKQIALNMASSVAVFVLNLCVSFFLTPFIVSRLGTAAYGFVGLSNNIVGYTALLTVAINSMAGRFVTIKVHEGDIKQANIYLSSVFFANIILAGFIMAGLSATVLFLPDIINIPENLVGDVRILFSLLAVSTCLGLMVGIISVSTFIRNRLDYSNIRSLIGTVIRVVLLLLLFGLLTPRLWYIGISVVVMEIYGMVSNYWFFKHLTPELKIKRSDFDFRRLMEVTAAGAWNIISRLSEILSRGFDLLFANIFISSYTMGLLSICNTIPMLVLSFFGTITGNFAPEFMGLYARKDMEGLKSSLLTSVRLTSFLSCIPLSIIFAYSDMFYSLWLPGEDARMLYLLTICVTCAMSVGMPQEPLWNIFTVTNQIKKSSLNLLYNSLMTFSVVLICMLVVKDSLTRLFILASVRSFFGLLRCLIFLPRYGAKCLDFDSYTFYPLIFKNLLNIAAITALSVCFKHYMLECSWTSLFVGCMTTAILGIVFSSITILRASDREYLLNWLKTKALRIK